MLHLLFNRFSEISSWEDSATLPSDVAWGLTIGHEGRWGLSTRNLRDSFSVKRPRHLCYLIRKCKQLVVFKRVLQTRSKSQNNYSAHDSHYFDLHVTFIKIKRLLRTLTLFIKNEINKYRKPMVIGVYNANSPLSTKPDPIIYSVPYCSILNIWTIYLTIAKLNNVPMTRVE